MDYRFFADLAAEVNIPADGILSRVLYNDDSVRVVIFGFAPGQELTEHTSTQQAMIQVLSGECEFTVSGKVHNLKAGDFLYLPAHAPHALKATRQFSMLLTLLKPGEAS